MMEHTRFTDYRGARNRAPREFKQHRAVKDGEVMDVAESNVVSTHPNNSIKNVASLMRDNDFRRLPITDAGTGRLEGMAVAIDILDFLGGGEKYKIIEEDYKGNFLSAINSPIQRIMAKSTFVDRKATIEDIVDIIIDDKTSFIPIVNKKDDLTLVGVVTERDVLPEPSDYGITVGDVMKKDVIASSLGMMMSDVTKVMVRNRLRRLPVMREDELIGVVTVFDVLGYLERGQFKGVDAEENLSTRVDEIMEKTVVSVSPGDDLGVIPELVSETGFGGFPVVSDGKLVGIVTTTDVIRWVYRDSSN